MPRDGGIASFETTPRPRGRARRSVQQISRRAVASEC
jgi:hypothetical protein